MLDHLPFGSIEANLSPYQLYPSFEFFGIFGEIIKVLAEDLEFSDAIQVPFLVELAYQNVGDLEAIEVEGGCVLVKKVIENNFTRLI